MIMINQGFIMINFFEIQGLILNNSIVDFFLIMINLREMLPLANYRSWQDATGAGKRETIMKWATATI